jgi:exodeoxyribonuclease V alpha subunit
MKALSPGSIAVVAPTGKAAVRLTEVMGNAGLPIEAKTIHSFVGVKSIRNDGEIILDDATKPVSFVVVDESSMIPARLLASMLRVLPGDCCVLFLGDTDQLPPIGHGAPLRDIVSSNTIPVGRLTEVRRNSGAIVRVCSEIANRSEYVPPKIVRESTGDNAIHAECSTSSILSRVESIFRSPPPGIDSLQIQVLSPLKKRDSPVGTPAINERIRAIVNPSASGPIGTGDKVYVKKNESMDQVEKQPDGSWGNVAETFVANGEFGIVVDVVPKGTGKGNKHGLVVKLDAPARTVLVTQPSLLDFGWATTVHKSQGSEWPIVVTVADKSAAMMGSKQLIYTAVSRAKRLSITVGQMSTIGQWCKRDMIRSRRTMLTEKLREKGSV